MRRRLLQTVAVLGALAFGTGCAGQKVYLAGHAVSTGKVAILPMANGSNDLDAPLFLRMLIRDAMMARGFQVLDLAAIDAALKQNGFTDGGQLRAATPQQLGQWTGADTLFYTDIENFDYINVGFYARRRVRMVARLVDAKTGERLWEAEREGSTRIVVANKKQAEREFAVQLAVKAVEKATHRPLQAESHLAVERLLNTLPYR